jgi:pSer/pThr/pTyr-binding forkhead associated (FHA) protein
MDVATWRRAGPLAVAPRTAEVNAGPTATSGGRAPCHEAFKPGAGLVAEGLPNAFWLSCGATGPLQLDVTRPDGHRPEHRLLPEPYAVVGRSASADVFLYHKDVSRRHVYLQVIGGRVFCVDLGSRSGTRMKAEGKPTASFWLDESIHVGPFEIRVPEDRGVGNCVDPWLKPPFDPFSSRFSASDNLPDVTLEFRNKSKCFASWPMDRVLVLLGRTPLCKFQLKSDNISGVQCSVLRTPGGTWVVDLIGQGRVMVNRRVVGFARLEDGDELQVAGYRIGFHSTAPSLPSGRQLEGPTPGDRAVPALRGTTLGLPGPRNRAAESLPVVAEPWDPDEPDRHVGGERAPLSRRPQEAEVLDPSLTPVVAQLARMQREMFEQFRQTMQQQMSDQFEQFVWNFAQVMSLTGQEHLGMLRDELSGLHQLTQELQGLKAELEVRRNGATPGVPGGPALSAGPTAHATGKPADEPLSGAIAGSGGTDGPATGAGAEFHDLLTERIAAIQREQQSRWKKISSLIIGSLGGGSTL